MKSLDYIINHIPYLAYSDDFSVVEVNPHCMVTARMSESLSFFNRDVVDSIYEAIRE
jgi:hypothetical protein